MKVVFDTDPGIDDAMALLYLHALQEKITLLGITTILGNASIDQCTRNARYLCDMFGIDVPVYQGAGAAIDGTVPEAYPDFVHGANGLGDVDIPEPVTALQSGAAADYLVETAREYRGELTLMAVGRLTNVALAIKKDPAFARHLKELIIMGGAWQCEGNVTPFAEANIIGDPEAAQIVFEAGIPLVMVGLDVTMKTRMTNHYLTELCDGIGSTGKFLQAIHRAYEQYHLDSLGWNESPVHDPSAVAFADEPAFFTTVTGELNCVLQGEQRGRTLFNPTDNGRHRVCVDVDSQALLDRYAEVLKDHLT